MLRAIFWSLLLWFVARLAAITMRVVRGSGAGSAPPPQPGPPPPRGGRSGTTPVLERLIQDPVCGLRLPESKALWADGQGFCSEACRDQFRRR